MKVFLLLIMLTIPLVAQDRDMPAKRRATRLPPQLIENPDSHIASGIAQAPTGYPVIIGTDVVPHNSIIGLYGTLLKRNNVAEVLIMANGKGYSLRVAVNPQLFPKLEMMVFRLPPEITGEVLVRTAGLTESNWVRFYVE